MFLIDCPYLHHGYFRQYLATYTVSLTLIICGTAIAWPSPVIPELKDGDPFKITLDEASWMVSVMYVGNILSPIPVGYLMDTFGRKITLLTLNTIPFLSWIIIIFVHNVPGLYIARFFQGLWLGIAYTVVPIYMGEIAEPAIRGSISTNFQTMIYVGVLIEYAVGPYVTYNVLGIVSVCFPILFFILFPFMPETPYFHLMKSETDKARKCLKWLRSPSYNIDDELMKINGFILKQREEKKSFKDMLRGKATLKALLIVSVLSIFQRFSGIGPMMAYGSISLTDDGLRPLTSDDCVIIISIVWIVFGFSSTYLAAKFSRKFLLVLSSAGSAIAMCLAGVWFYYHPHVKEPNLPLAWAPFACFVVYGASYSIGLGPIVTTIKGEIFPSSVKGIASGITTIVMAASSFVVNKIYTPLQNGPGIYVNFFIYFVISCLTIIFTLTVVIETKGKTLEEIQIKLSRPKRNVSLIEDAYRGNINRVEETEDEITTNSYPKI